MHKITISVEGKSYNISLTENNLESEMECIKKYVSLEKDNDIKSLLYAYIKKCFEYSELERELKKSIAKMEGV